MLGEGYSPEGFEGPGLSLGDEGRGLNAVEPGDSEQLDSEPESSWRRFLSASSSCPIEIKQKKMNQSSV